MLLVLLSLANAQSTETPKQPVHNIEFDGLNLDAEMVRPTVSLIEDRQKAVFPSLVKLRADFAPELSESVEEVK